MKSIYRFFQEGQNRRLVERLKNHGLSMTATVRRQRLPQFFAGKIFVITATLDGLTRDEAKALIEQRGGRVTSAVSKKTDRLAAGRDPGSKLESWRKRASPGLRSLMRATLRRML